MEEGKQSGSSLASDLFGAKDSTTAASSSAGVFGSIFAPPPKVWGRESVHSPETEKKNSHGNQAWTPKTGVSENKIPGVEGQGQSTTIKHNSSYFQEEKVEPFHYSSSIYYGGQDFHSLPQGDDNSETTTFDKHTVEDDSGSASRGNWWQGSLYY